MYSSQQPEFPFLAGGGQMAELIARFDWGQTSLGPLPLWPAHVRTATSLMMRSQVAIVMLWGEAGHMVYNDAYSVFAGARHPHLLGAPVREGWPEVSDFNDRVMKVGLADGTLSFKDQELELHRNGVPERVWMDLDYSPLLDESGRPVGVMAIVVETTAKVKAQQFAQGEGERLAQLFAQAPSFMALLEGPEHRFALANSHFLKLIGGRNVIGRTMAEALADVASQGYAHLLDSVYESGQPYSAHGAKYRMQANEGAEVAQRYLDFVYQPIRDASGAVSGIFVVGSDVTDRVEADQRRDVLARLTEAFRTMGNPLDIQFAAAQILGRSLGASRVGYGSVDPDAETLVVERDWTAEGVDSTAAAVPLRTYGSFIESLKADEFISISDVRDDPRTSMAASRLEKKSARSFVNVPVVENGRLTAMLYVNDSQPRQWTVEEHALIRDVAERTRIATERARAMQVLSASERSLRESEAKFRTIANAMPQMVWSALPDGYHDYYNDQWYEFTGVPKGSTDGQGWNGMFHPKDQDRAWAAWRRSLETGAVYEIEYRLRHNSGAYRWVLGRALPVRAEAGEIVRWMGTCTDIHAQKMAQDELEASNRRKDEFLAMLAHELRNPLAPISTAAHLLQATPANAALVERTASIVSRQVRHMTALVDDLLDVSRVTRGLVELERKPVDLKAAIGLAVEQVRPLIEERQHTLGIELPAQDVSVLGDRVRLVQILSNLLANAAKYTPRHGAISLTLVAGDRAQVRVVDNGIGMEPELLPHVFELFTQGERTPERGQGGLGLGLALVNSLVALHGGTVRASSAGRGLGSSFVVELPLMQPLSREHAPPAAQPRSLATPRSRRILVVDDNRDAAETLGVVLEIMGHEVSTAHDAAAAVKASATGAHDVFILDIGLPGLDGYALARKLRAHRNGTPATLIALTGYGGIQDRQRAVEAGFDHYLIKPADLAELERLLG